MRRLRRSTARASWPHVVAAALGGASKRESLDASSLRLASPGVSALASGSYLRKSEVEIAGTGYAVASLEAALWCFHQTESFEQAILRAANLGDDADTTAAIVGQIAGAYYGLDAIPAVWRERLHMGAEIEQIACRLGAVCGAD